MCRCRSRFRYPQDARHQLQSAREFIEREFGARAGRSVAFGRLGFRRSALARGRCGFEWAASDNGVLAQTLRKTRRREVPIARIVWQQGEREMRMIFRDHFLSD